MILFYYLCRSSVVKISAGIEKAMTTNIKQDSGITQYRTFRLRMYVID